MARCSCSPSLPMTSSFQPRRSTGSLISGSRSSPIARGSEFKIQVLPGSTRFCRVLPGSAGFWVRSESRQAKENPDRYNSPDVRIEAFALVLIVGCGAAAFLYYERVTVAPAAPVVQPADDDAWIDHLYHANPADVEAATRQVQQLGPRALPLIHQTFQDSAATTEHLKAALKACSILGPAAAPAIDE